MKNLRLISKLQPSDMVTLILQAKPGEKLDYYIVARSTNYSIIASGECDGSVPDEGCTFNILLSSLYPLIDKGYVFRIKYNAGQIEFVSEDERMHLSPLCVQYLDPAAEAIVHRLQRLAEARSQDTDAGSKAAKAEAELRQLQQRYDSVSKMKLESAITSGSPFDDVDSFKPSEALSEAIGQKRLELSELQKQARQLHEVNLKAFRALALAGSRYHEMINFCDDFAVIALKNTFILQRGACPAMAVQGTLLHQLLTYGAGDGFLWFDNGLVFTVGDKKEQTTVFMEKYLPNTTVDSSIVKRGATLEKYSLRMKGILSITQLMKSKFPDITLSMGDGIITLENDKGERLTNKFDIENADTNQLRKMMRGEQVKGDITMATISIPAEVQSLLSLFKDQMEIYVKERKIIFRSEDLYVVFGRGV